MIMHIDMNAFFAGVEQSVNPALRGKPIGVIGSGKRTVVTTASYEARAFGVKTGMTVYEARKLCPRIILVVGNNQRYTDTCTKLVELYHSYTPVVEVYSIDECFLDMAGTAKNIEELKPVALAIKKAIVDRFHLTCSIGIAPNKLVAKLASDMQKPNGLVLIRQEDIPGVMEHLPVQDLCGIGRKMREHLFYMGITTCGELSRAPVERLKHRFGVVGEYLHYMALGQDNSPVVTLDQTPADKSVGHSMTIDHDVAGRDEMETYLLQLSEKVGRRMRKNHFTGRTVALTVRYADFTSFTKRKSVPEFLYNSSDIYLVARQMLQEVKLKMPVRLLGVSVANLAQDVLQLPLLENEQKKIKATNALDAINDKFGEHTVTRARLLEQYRPGGVISPSWKPAGAKRVEFD
jgi:DNA polymerase IV